MSRTSPPCPSPMVLLESPLGLPSGLRPASVMASVATTVTVPARPLGRAADAGPPGERERVHPHLDVAPVATTG